jgi:hypothetical protein
VGNARAWCLEGFVLATTSLNLISNSKIFETFFFWSNKIFETFDDISCKVVGRKKKQ